MFSMTDKHCVAEHGAEMYVYPLVSVVTYCWQADERTAPKYRFATVVTSGPEHSSPPGDVLDAGDVFDVVAELDDATALTVNVELESAPHPSRPFCSVVNLFSLVPPLSLADNVQLGSFDAVFFRAVRQVTASHGTDSVEPLAYS